MRLLSLICLVVLVSCASKPKDYYDVKLTLHQKARCEYAAYIRQPNGIIARHAVCFQTLHDNYPDRCALRMIDLQDDTYWTEVQYNYWAEGACDKANIISILKRERIRDVVIGMVEKVDGRYHTIQDTHLVALKFEEMFTPRN